MIAVFTRFERDFKEMELTPKTMFVRIRDINNVRGKKFSGIIRTLGWYRGETQMIEAYDYLRVIQPEIFD